MALGSAADPSIRNWLLDLLYGDGRAPLVSATVKVALFHGNPTSGGTELTSTGGYARVTVDNTTANFPNAVDGSKTNANTIQFPTSTAAFSNGADHWATFTSDGHLMNSGPITDPGTGDPTTLTVDSDAEVVRLLANTLTITVA